MKPAAPGTLAGAFIEVPHGGRPASRGDAADGDIATTAADQENLLDEIAALLSAGIARAVEADGAQQADASGVGIEIAIGRLHGCMRHPFAA